MRDPKRIDRICDELRYVWKNVPDWRLGQLIANLTRMTSVSDPFFVEDDKMEEAIVMLKKTIDSQASGKRS